VDDAGRSSPPCWSAAEGWLRQQGMKRAIGPVSFRCGTSPACWSTASTPALCDDPSPALLIRAASPPMATKSGRPDRLSLGPDADQRPLDKLLARAMRGARSPCATSMDKASGSESPCCWTSSTMPGRTIGGMCP
jgi:hypothetical protein